MKIINSNDMHDLNEKIQNAICNNDIDYIRYFIETYGVDYRFLDDDNDTLFFYSISDSGSEAYKTILKYQPNLKHINDLGETIFHSIAYSGEIVRLDQVLKIDDSLISNLNLQSNDGVTPLLLAISIEKFEMALELVRLGADVNIPDENGLSPIHLASSLDNLALVKSLVESRADLRKRTNSGNLPLALAVNQGNLDVITYLFEKMYR